MPRWHTDDVDVACEAWARQWVENFGRAPDRAGRAIGPLNCTLGRVRELHDGASSTTEHGRRWPEVFLGQALLVSIALKAMRSSQREIVFAHYVMRCFDTQAWTPLRHPLRQRLIAQRLGLSLPDYYRRRDVAKDCIRTVLFIDSKTVADSRKPLLDTGHEHREFRALQG